MSTYRGPRAFRLLLATECLLIELSLVKKSETLSQQLQNRYVLFLINEMPFRLQRNRVRVLAACDRRSTMFQASIKSGEVRWRFSNTDSLLTANKC